MVQTRHLGIQPIDRGPGVVHLQVESLERVCARHLRRGHRALPLDALAQLAVRQPLAVRPGQMDLLLECAVLDFQLADCVGRTI